MSLFWKNNTGLEINPCEKLDSLSNLSKFADKISVKTIREPSQDIFSHTIPMHLWYAMKALVS